MLHLDKGTIFLETSEKCGIIYNNAVKKMMKVNASVISILKMCNGRKTPEEITDFFDSTVRGTVRNTISYLKAEGFLHEEDFRIPRNRQYCDIATYYLSLTGRCNLKCHFCLKYAPQTYKELSLEEWVNIVDCIGDFNNRQKTLYISGGEPLIYHRFKELYRYIFKKDMKINIFSNGTLFDKEYLDMFRELPPNAILLSIDGSNAGLHDRQRGVPGTFEKLINATKRILEYGIQTDVVWQSVIDRNNLNDMENIVILALKTEVKNVHFGMISSIGRGMEDADILTEDMMVEFYDKIVTLSKKYRGNLTINQPLYNIQSESPLEFCSCGIGNMLHIDERGYVTPCYGLLSEEFKNGPVLSVGDIKKVLTDNFYGRAVEDYRDCSVCGIRNICNGGCKAEIYYTTGDINGCYEKKKRALTKYLVKKLAGG